MTTILNQHYGLSGHPFQGSVAGPALYLSRTHREALAALRWGLQEPSGFTLVTGEPGSGKTTLIYTLLARTDPDVRVVHLANPKLSFREMLALILAELGIKSRLSRLAMHQALDGALAALAPGHRLALIVDEAQALSDETLDELRLLSNLPAAAANPLQLLLVAQPELLERMRGTGLRQLSERIGARAQLQRLDRAEIYQYIDCRLKAVGGHRDAIFTPRALRRLAINSRGLPRRINVLCHNAMLLAYVANKRRVDSRMVASAGREYDGWLERGTAAPSAASRDWLRKSMPVAAALLLALGAWNLAPPAYRFWESGLWAAAMRTAPHDGSRLAAQHAATGAGDAGAAVSYHRSESTGSAAISALPAVAGAARASAPAPAAAAPAGVSSDNHRISGAGRDAREAAHIPGDRQPRTRITIREGDTVADLATRYLGSSTHDTLARVARANPQIRDINMVYPGETVLLPGGAGESSR